MEEIIRIQKMVKSKIVATIGPATSSVEKLKELAQAGVDVFRLNFSHASKEGTEMQELFECIRQNTPEIAILCDIQGPKIRIGKMAEPVILKYSEKFYLYEEDRIGDQNGASISYKGFYNDVNEGDSIFINDGLVRLQVKTKDPKKIKYMHIILPPFL